MDVAQLARRQPRVGQAADADRQIEALVHQIDHAAGQVGLDTDLRVAVQVVADPLADRDQPELDTAGQAQRAAWLGVHLLAQALHFIGRAQNTHGALEHLAPQVGE